MVTRCGSERVFYGAEIKVSKPLRSKARVYFSTTLPRRALRRGRENLSRPRSRIGREYFRRAYLKWLIFIFIQVGARLTFSRDGSTASTAPIARGVGTTMTVKNLFASLPVRQRDFERNAKRHCAKALKVIHAYALSATHCRMRVTTQLGGKRTMAMAVAAGRTTKEAAAHVAVSHLLPALAVALASHFRGHPQVPVWRRVCAGPSPLRGRLRTHFWIRVAPQRGRRTVRGRSPVYILQRPADRRAQVRASRQ